MVGITIILPRDRFSADKSRYAVVFVTFQGRIQARQYNALLMDTKAKAGESDNKGSLSGRGIHHRLAREHRATPHGSMSTTYVAMVYGGMNLAVP